MPTPLSPPINQALLPAGIRNGNAAAKNAYQEALGFEQILVSQLAQQLVKGLDSSANAGSYPGYVFTGEPVKLPAGHFGLGHGSGAHAPDEYYVIESANPKIQGFDGAVMSFVQYLYELAK